MAIIQNKPNMNYGLWGSNGNIAVPTSEKVDLGWIIEKPPNEMMNWVQNRQDSMLQFINQRGIPTWDALTEYAKDSYTVRNGILYKAVSQNIDKDPTLNSAIWNISFASQTDYTNLYNDVQKIKNQKGYLSDYVQKSAPVMTADAKGIGYKNSTGVSGLTFSGVTPQVVRNNAVVAEFSGGNNPKDVVTFEALNELLKIKIGALYFTTISENPKITLGYGTWEKYAKGEAIVGHSDDISSNTPDWVKVAGGKFGKYSETLTESQIPTIRAQTVITRAGQQSSNSDWTFLGDSDGHANDGVKDSVGLMKSQPFGGGQAHNNVQPSIVVFIWRRVS